MAMKNEITATASESVSLYTHVAVMKTVHAGTAAANNLHFALSLCRG